MQALHSALLQPHLFLPGLPQGLGGSAEQEDACLAYALFDQASKAAGRGSRAGRALGCSAALLR